MEIRKIDLVDIPQLCRIHAECFIQPYDLPWDEKKFQTALMSPRSLAFKAVETDPFQIMGMVLADCSPDSVDILTLSVAKAFRRSGIAGALLDAMTSCCEGKHRFVEVAVTNIGAVSFYRQYGFQEIGRRKGYYQTKGPKAVVVDAFVMRV